MIVDVHAHVIVPEILRGIAGDEAWRPSVHWEGGAQVVELGGQAIRSATREFVRIDRVLAEEESSGVDHVVLSPWVALLPYALDLEDGLRVCRLQNESLAAIAASIRGDYLGDDRFLPFWEVAESSGALIFVHPTTRGFELPAFRDYYLWNTVGNPLETAITGAHLVMSGVLERHPRLRVLLAHGGGALPAVRGRLRHSHGFQPLAKARLRESPDMSLRRLYYDTITHDAELLRALVVYAGPDHVLLGSDHPFDMGTTRPVDEVREL